MDPRPLQGIGGLYGHQAFPPLDNQPIHMITNNPNIIPVVNTQNGQVFPLTLNGMNLHNFTFANQAGGANPEPFTGIPFAYHPFPLDPPKEEPNQNELANGNGLRNEGANMPNNQQLNILQPNMIFGNIMPVPNNYFAQRPIPPPQPPIQNHYPVAPQRNPLPPHWNIPPPQFAHPVPHDIDGNVTPALSSPDVTDDESNWTEFDKVLKTKQLLNKALKYLHKADLIEKDQEILQICDSVEVKIKKTYERLDNMDAE